MDQPPSEQMASDYDTDVLVWSERQAAILRDLAASGLALPNELDLENIVEEIESVGRSELASVESYARQMLIHLVKLVASPNAEPVTHWMEEILTFHDDLLARLTPSMRQRIDLDRAWRRASHRVVTSLALHGEAKPVLPRDCPLELDDLLAESFDLEGALAKVRAAVDALRPKDS